MDDYFGGQSAVELEALLRRLIEQGAEGPKVDFKRAVSWADKAAQAELAKDLSSIANTDDETHFEDFGYIILGAERGALLGGVVDLAGDVDRLQAQVTDVIKGLLAPVPQFSICSFIDPTLGAWGAIIIPPSARQPHIFIRDGAANVNKHEWWVRVNDTKERGGPHDYARFLAKAVAREVRPLDREVQRLGLLVEARHAQPDLATLLGSLPGAVRNPPDDQVTPPEPLSATIRRQFVRGTAGIEDALVAESLRLAEVMAGSSDRNPWDFTGATPARLRDVIGYLEEQAFPLADALAAAARYDSEGALTEAICRALRVLAREPPAPGMHYEHASRFRLYPLVICLYALIIVATNEGREPLLKAVLALSLENEHRDVANPIVASFRRLNAASPLFLGALEGDYAVAVPVRVRDVLLPRLGALLAGTPPKEAFFVAELVISLAFMRISADYYMIATSSPLPGLFMYDYSASRPIKRFLRRRPVWLAEVLGGDLDVLLATYDATANTALIRGAFGDGFVSGAAEAFGVQAPR